MNDEDRKKRTAWAAWGILALFVLLGAVFVIEIRDAQVGIWTSPLPEAEKYLWFGRLQTSKVLIAAGALSLGLVGASYARRTGQRPE